MTIHLSKDQEQFVHNAVRAGHYVNEDEVVNDALARLRTVLPEGGQGHKAPKEPTKSAEQDKPLTREEFDKHLLAIGLLSQLPDTAADFDDPDDGPIQIQGEPLSETVIRERR